jgi:hypothetical protein
MRIFVFLLLIAAGLPAAAADVTPKDKCKHDKIKDDRIAAFYSQVEQHPFYSDAVKRSKFTDCTNFDLGFNLHFKNGDRIEYRLSDIAPAVEYFFAKPRSEKEAFALAQSALISVGGKPCEFKMNEPSDTKDGAKVYWCEDTSAVSVTLNKKKRATQVRRWTLH